MRTISNILFALCILFINVLNQSHCLTCPNEIWLNETIAIGEDVYDFQTCTVTGGTCPSNSSLTMECHDVTDPPLFPLGVSGNLSIIALKALDREEKDLYTLKCYVSINDTLCNSFDFVIHITDVNDNAPMFTQPTYTISIFETDSASTNIVKISESSIVSDLDSDPYSEFVVELFDSSLEIQDVFNLITNNDLTGIYYIENAQPLDREFQSYYILTLVAKDVLNKSLSSTAQLIIEIGDLNDNGPMIQDNVVIIIVPEDTEIGAEVGYVAVTDLDVYPNNQMQFYLNTVCTYATSSIDSLLILNSETGVFTLKYAVDAEGDVVDSLDAIVIVIDPTVDNRFDCAPIRVEVSDVNDNTPEISITRTTESVVEETDNGSEIVRFVITDKDSLENGRVDMDFNCGDAFDCSQYFRLDRFPPLFTFVMQQPLDYELTSQVNITFEYFDNGTNRNRGIFELILPVIPVNEFTPEFPSYEISCSVGEDVRVGGYICEEARATDGDAGTDGDIIYFVLEETALPSIDAINQNFMFDMTENYLVLLKEFDFETLSSNETNFFFKVNASNIDGRHSIAEISIRFIDVNDNAPYIESIASSFEIPEDTRKGFTVVALQTGDNDSDENGRVTVSLLSADPVPFVVEYSEEGWVLVTDALLDREIQSSYNLALLATDHGDTPLHSAIHNFSITLLDVNDNRPYFENSMYTFTLIMANDTWAIPVIDKDSQVIAEIRLDFGDYIELDSALIVDEFRHHIILINPAAITEGSYEFTIYVRDPSLSADEISTRCTFRYRPAGTGLPEEDVSLAPILAGIGLSILLLLILLVIISIFCLIFFALRRRTHRVKYQPQVRRRKNPSLHLPASILKQSSRLSEGKKKVSFNSNVHLMTFSPHKGTSSETSYTTSDISNEEQGNQWPNGVNRKVPNYSSRIIDDPESWIPSPKQPYHQSRRQDIFTNSTSSECLDTKDSNAPLIEPNHVYYQNVQEIMISNKHAHNYNMIDTNRVQSGYSNCYENQVTSSEDSDVMGDNVLYNPIHDGTDSENSDDSERPPYGAVPLYISSDMTSEGDLSTGMCSDYDTNMSNQADYCMTNIPSDSYDGEITV